MSDGSGTDMDVASLVGYLMPFDGREGLSHPASIDEARQILAGHPGLSCLVVAQRNERYRFEELLCSDKACLDRSENVFDSIKALIKTHRIAVAGTRFIFHFKSDACEYQSQFAVLSNSRDVGNPRVVLWPLLMKKECLLTFTRYKPHLHHEITRYLKAPDSISWARKASVFFFRGMNSGNPFTSIQYPWNRFRRSRQDLLVEALRLPQDLQVLVDIGFNKLYPKRQILERQLAAPALLEEQFTGYLRDGCSISDLRYDIELLLAQIKPSLSMQQMYGFRYIFCPEGFDCSSALPWVLASNSLAIVPPFHYENVIVNSQALKPYVHFVPIREDFGDLPEVMRWVLAHDAECQQIVRNANDYMRPFVDQQCMITVQKAIIEKLVS